MSAMALAHAHPRPQTRPEQPRLVAVAGGAPSAQRSASPTLAAVLSDGWAALTAGAATDCPVCGTAMEPRWSAGHGSVGGRCRGCGSSLV